MEFKPKVSIIIPVYNGANFLGEAIESALAQTYHNIEILVVNDGSTDDGATEKVAKSYGTKIRYFLKENGKVASALNFGIKHMAGEYFSWLSHDDVFYPTKIEKEINYIKKYPDTKIVYEDYDFIDPTGKKIGEVKSGDLDPKRLLYQLFLSSPVNGCNMLIHKSCFERVGLFNLTLRTTQDYDMWFRLALPFSMVHLDFVGGGNRMHEARDTRTLSDLCIAEGNEMNIKYLTQIEPALLLKSSGMTDYAALLLHLARVLTTKNYAKAAQFAFQRSLKARKNKSDPNYLLQAASFALFYRGYNLLRTLKYSILRPTKRAA